MLPPIDESVIKFFAWLAMKRYGDRGDGIFNSACFASVIHDLLGLPIPDGYVTRLILAGRTDIKQLTGACHWKLTIGRGEC